MKKAIITLMFFLIVTYAKSQTAEDLFKSNDTKISWLGIDFSHVKLIGDFSQFATAGKKSSVQIRDEYFPSWNKLILSEPKKYDIKGMLRKNDILYDIYMIRNVNVDANVEDMESYNIPNYSRNDIQSFVDQYTLESNDGIGILFIAECLNKNTNEAYFHFVALNMETKEILIQERLRGEPMGFGIRNYWAGSIYSIIKDINDKHYRKWKAEYTKK